jgi:hypothetical protein
MKYLLMSVGLRPDMVLMERWTLKKTGSEVKTQQPDEG